MSRCNKVIICGKSLNTEQGAHNIMITIAFISAFLGLFKSSYFNPLVVKSNPLPGSRLVLMVQFCSLVEMSLEYSTRSPVCNEVAF